MGEIIRPWDTDGYLVVGSPIRFTTGRLHPEPQGGHVVGIRMVADNDPDDELGIPLDSIDPNLLGSPQLARNVVFDVRLADGTERWCWADQVEVQHAT